MKSCVKMLEVQQLREKSAPTPINFGPLFEVHSGHADGVSSSQWGGRTVGCCPWELLAFILLTAFCIYVPHPLVSSERLTCREKRQFGENWCGSTKLVAIQ